VHQAALGHIGCSLVLDKPDLSATILLVPDVAGTSQHFEREG
jgi:hypothetical protein